MQLSAPGSDQNPNRQADLSIGRIVSVTGSKAIVLLDGGHSPAATTKRGAMGLQRPEMGTLLAIDTVNTVVLAIVSALSVPVPAQREGDTEIWIAELGLVGELWRPKDNRPGSFNRGVTAYPTLGDRVRIASKPELELAFCGDMRGSVRVGAIRQDASIPAMIKVDDLLGKHFAILGTTGTGKSCTTALILRAILQDNPAAHLVLLDPHNEYASAFPEWGEVISPRNMQLPFWLLTFEEFTEVVLGSNAADRKAEIEILIELIPIVKGRYSQSRGDRKDPQTLRKGINPDTKYTVDTPVPYRISDLTALIDDRMGKLENKKDLSPYRNIKQKIDQISQDPRYGFMFGSLTVHDAMAQILSRIFRVPVNNKPITILELTGIPPEVVNVVVAVLCRMTFDFALWSEGKVPVTIVCEEAHRYVPAKSDGFEPCKRAIAKIAKEGRKYGASLCIVTQRPAEIDPTILSQCNTVFALRMSNDRDQEIVRSSISDTGSGLLEFLSALGQREAIAFGEGVTLPVRIKFDELAKQHMPRSSSAKFTEKWQSAATEEGFLEAVVERWRSSSSGEADMSQSVAMLADSLGGSNADDQYGMAPQQQPAFDAPMQRPRAMAPPMADAPAARMAPAGASAGASGMARPAGGMLRREAPAAETPVARAPSPAPAQPTDQGALKSLREKLLQRSK